MGHGHPADSGMLHLSIASKPFCKRSQRRRSQSRSCQRAPAPPFPRRRSSLCLRTDDAGSRSRKPEARAPRTYRPWTTSALQRRPRDDTTQVIPVVNPFPAVAQRVSHPGLPSDLGSEVGSPGPSQARRGQKLEIKDQGAAGVRGSPPRRSLVAACLSMPSVRWGSSPRGPTPPAGVPLLVPSSTPHLSVFPVVPVHERRGHSAAGVLTRCSPIGVALRRAEGEERVENPHRHGARAWDGGSSRASDPARRCRRR